MKTRYNNMFVVDNIGRSGGLALFWNKEVDVEIKNYSQRHINAEVCSEQNGWPSMEIHGLLWKPRT